MDDPIGVVHTTVLMLLNLFCSSCSLFCNLYVYCSDLLVLVSN